MTARDRWIENLRAVVHPPTPRTFRARPTYVELTMLHHLEYVPVL